MPPRPSSIAALRPTMLARYLQTTAPIPPPAATSLPPLGPASSTSKAGPSSLLPRTNTLKPLLPPSPSTTPSLPQTTSEALSLISTQSTPATGRYVVARLHARTYLLHPRDILTIPTLKPYSPPGTTLSLTRILEVGSREYAIRSPAAEGKSLRKGILNVPPGEDGLGNVGELDSIPPWIANCELTIIEHTKSPLETLLKKKRRKGYEKTIQHKQGWTRLRVGDIHLGDGVPPVASAGLE